MSEPDIQIQRDYPQTLVNSQWVKWAAERIAELEANATDQAEFTSRIMADRDSIKAQLAELRDAARDIVNYISTRSRGRENHYGGRLLKQTDKLAALLQEDGE